MAASTGVDNWNKNWKGKGNISTLVKVNSATLYEEDGNPSQAVLTKGMSVTYIDNKSSSHTRVAIQVGENQFVDDRTEAVGEEFDTPDINLTPRRPPVKMIEVVCNACGRKEKINPAYKTGSYHRCSRCVG